MGGQIAQTVICMTCHFQHLQLPLRQAIGLERSISVDLFLTFRGKSLPTSPGSV
jgi:hypothetical protein